MRALTPKQQAFVVNYLEYPTSTATRAAKRAGYEITTGKSGAGPKVSAWRNLRHPKILAAIQEELHKRFHGDAVIGRRVLLEIALNKTHPHQLKAALALLDRGGFHSMSEQKITVDHRDMTGEAMIERIKALCAELNMDPVKLIGHQAGTAPITIEATIVKDASIAEPAPAAPAPKITRYVQRAMVPEFLRAGWTAPQPNSNADLIEVQWIGEGEPAIPDTRPLLADPFSAR
jgi:phage terminase small subunit